MNDALSSLAMRSVCGLVEPSPAPASISQRTEEGVQSTISNHPQLSLSAEQDNAPGYTSGHSSISADRIIVESNDAASNPAMNVCGPVESSPAPINSQQAAEAVRYANQGPVQPLLSAEQENVLRLVKKGENVFFTGSAGGRYFSHLCCGKGQFHLRNSFSQVQGKVSYFKRLSKLWAVKVHRALLLRRPQALPQSASEGQLCILGRVSVLVKSAPGTSQPKFGASRLAIGGWMYGRSSSMKVSNFLALSAARRTP